MPSSFLLYPSFNEEFEKKVRFQPSKYTFFYTDKEGDEHELEAETTDSVSNTNILHSDGAWTQDTCNLGFRRRISLRFFKCLFGSKGIVCSDARLGIAITWTSADSKQRGAIRVCSFGVSDEMVEEEIDFQFTRAQLRGRVDFTTKLFVESAGHPREDELHLANIVGYTLGELDTFTLLLDGNGSMFPIYEKALPSQPLWLVRCDWTDPLEEKFEETVSVILNTAHKNYSRLDPNAGRNYDEQLMPEIMASAVTIIVEKIRQSGVWDEIFTDKNYSQGSVGEVLYYFEDGLGWDLSTPENVSLSVRKHFEQRG